MLFANRWVNLVFVSSILFAASSQVDAKVKKVGPGIYPALTLSYQHDDNIFRAEDNEVADNILQVTPSINLFALYKKHRFEAGYFVDIFRFDENKNEDFEDQYVNAKLDLSLTKRLKFDLEASYASAHEFRGASGARLDIDENPDTWWADRYLATVTYGRRKAKFMVKLSYEEYRRRYTNNLQEPRSRDRTRYIGDIFYNVGPKTQLFFEVGYTDYDYFEKDPLLTPIDLTSKEWTYLVGIAWIATAKTVGSFKVGYITKDMEDPGQKDFEGWSAWADIAWTPKKHTEWKLMLGRGTRESSSTTASYYDSIEAGIALDHDLSRRLTFLSKLLYQNDVYEQVDDTERTDDYLEFSAELAYSLKRWLDVSVNYLYTSRNSTLPGIDYVANVYMISLSMDTMK